MSIDKEIQEWAKLTNDFVFRPSKAVIEEKAVLFLLQYPSRYKAILMKIQEEKSVHFEDTASYIELETLRAQYDVYTIFLKYV